MFIGFGVLYLFIAWTEDPLAILQQMVVGLSRPEKALVEGDRVIIEGLQRVRPGGTVVASELISNEAPADAEAPRTTSGAQAH